MTRTSQKSSPKKQTKTKPPQKKRGLFGKLMLVFLNLGVWGLVVGAIGVAWFGYDLPSLDHLERSSRKPGITLLAKDGSLLATYGDLYGKFISLKDVPTYVPEAVIAIEDRRFYHHFGLDVLGLARALWANHQAGRVVQGGSSLTQQLAKDFLMQEGLYTYQDKSLRRKIQELILAFSLERRFSKDQILCLYLNRAYLGAGVYGIDSAALKYFGKHAKDLTLYEAAVLAGLLKAPSKYAPTSSPELCDARATTVLDTMVQAEFITKDQKDLALMMKTPLGITKKEAYFGRYFADWVFDLLPTLVGPLDRDLVVQTTLDPRLQREAETHARQSYQDHAKEAGFSQLAMVSMTPSGAVRAMIGGIDYGKSQFNRAYQAKRQMGSTFKIFVYLSALESGMTPQTMISDEPVRIGKWQPKNYLWRARGELSLQDSFAYSVNACAVRLARQMGIPALHDTAQRLGLTSPQPHDLTLSLGSGEASLLELIGAYATFSNKGYSVWPYGVLEIKDAHTGTALFTRTHKTNNRVISERGAKGCLDLLKAVMSYGTGKRAALSRPCAGKSGTSQDHRDAWFVGLTPDIITGVWMGNDNSTPTKDVTGGKYPGLLWKAYMEAIHQGVPVRDF
ncbi:MAG: PBP1A family penicillin-binding protein [Alphaproteobacteria bacterium]|nr:PBP1A family penicillin-binding protein [Alphaproteobacteria bacterium]